MSCSGEIPTMLISIFASPIPISFVSFVALFTPRSRFLELQTFRIFEFARIILGNGKSSLANNTFSVFHSIAVLNFAQFIRIDNHGIQAFLASIKSKSKASSNLASNTIKVEWFFTFVALVSPVVKAAWLFFQTLLLDCAQVILGSTLGAYPITIVVVAELILIHTGAIRFHYVIRIALFAMSFVGNQAVRELAAVVSQIISRCALLASSQEILHTSVNLAAFGGRVIAEWGSTRHTSPINIIASKFLMSTFPLVIHVVSLNAFDAIVVDIICLAILVSFVAESFITYFESLHALHAFVMFHLNAVGKGAGVVIGENVLSFAAPASF